MSQEPVPSSFALSPELDAIVQSSDIAYELISDSLGISVDAIEQIVEQLQRTMPKLTITNGHLLAFLQRELVGKAILDTVSHEAVSLSAREGDDASLMQQKIDQIARTYYTGSIWDLLESLAFCLRMVEIAYMNCIASQKSSSANSFHLSLLGLQRRCHEDRSVLMVSSQIGSQALYS